MTTRNSEISIVTSGGSVESSRKEILIAETKYHDVEKLYGPNAVAWSALHTVQRVFVYRNWVNTAVILFVGAVGIPIIWGMFVGTLTNGVQVRAGVRGIGASGGSSAPPAYIEAGYFGK